MYRRDRDNRRRPLSTFLLNDVTLSLNASSVIHAKKKRNNLQETMVQSLKLVNPFSVINSSRGNPQFTKVLTKVLCRKGETIS